MYISKLVSLFSVRYVIHTLELPHREAIPMSDCAQNSNVHLQRMSIE